MSIQYIRDKYRLPVKVSSVIRLNGVDVKVISAPRMYLKVRLPNGKVEERHPFDFDYCIDGAWQTGDELKCKYDAAWDAWNRRTARNCEATS